MFLICSPHFFEEVCDPSCKQIKVFIHKLEIVIKLCNSLGHVSILRCPCVIFKKGLPTPPPPF